MEKAIRLNPKPSIGRIALKAQLKPNIKTAFYVLLSILALVSLGFGKMKWEVKSFPPEFHRYGADGLVYNGKMWFMAGMQFPSSVVTNDVWAYDSQNGWVEVPQSSPFTARQLSQSVVFDNKMWIMGGSGSTTTSLTDVWYTSDGSNWTRATASADFGDAKFHSVISFGGYMWILSGMGEGGEESNRYRNDVWRSNNGINWEKITVTKPFPRRFGQRATVFDNKMWIVGGSKPTEGYYFDVWCSTNGTEWFKKADYKPSSDNLYVTEGIAIVDNKIIILDSYNAIPQHNDLNWKAWASYTGDSWERISSLDHPLSNANLPPILSYENRIWLMGINASHQGLVSKEAFDLVINSPNGQVVKSPPQMDYDNGATVGLTPNPNSGFVFSRWEGDAQGTGVPKSILMNADKYITAVFVPEGDKTLTVLNANGLGSETIYNIPEGGSQSIQATTPLWNQFSHWERVSGPGKASLNPSDNPATTVTLSGGNATIRGVFKKASLQVSIRDDASTDDTQVKPVIKVRNPSSTAVLSNFQIQFLIHADCFKDLISTPGNPSTGSWEISDITARDGDGNWVMTFTYQSLLGPLNEVETPLGITISYESGCVDCPKTLNKDKNIYAFKGVKKARRDTYFERKDKDHLVIYKSPIQNGDIPYFGTLPAFEIEYRPGKPPGMLRYDPIPVTLPENKTRQTPNVAFSWSFPHGNLISNGSFEHGKKGWAPLALSMDEPVFEILSHGPTTGERAFDGYHFAKVLPWASAPNEGLLYEIHESEPAYKSLEGHIASFSAWVRGDGRPGVRVKLVHLTLTSGPIYSEPIEVDDNWKYIEMSLVGHDPVGIPGDFKHRLGIVSEDNGDPFFVDGVALVPDRTATPPVPQTASTWYNTRNSVMQKRTMVPGPVSEFGYSPDLAKSIVSNTEYDSLGRVSKSYLPFTENCPHGQCNPFFDSAAFYASIGRANSEYVPNNQEGLPDAGGYAYSKTIYEQDQLTTVAKTGQPGVNYQAENPGATVDQNDHTVRTHYSGVTSLNESGLGADLAKPENKINPVFAYSHIIDQNQNETMQWKDGFGQVVKSVSVLVDGGQKRFISNENIYDNRGNLKMAIPPLSCIDRNNGPTGILNCVNPTEFFYNSENQLEREGSPDAGESRNFYDLLGTRRITQDATQRLDRKFSVSVYDDHGRTLYSGEYHDKTLSLANGQDGFISDAALRTLAKDRSWPPENNSQFRIFARYFYDEMPEPVPEELAAAYPNPGRPEYLKLYPEWEEGTFENTQSRLCAVIMRHKPVEDLDAATSAAVESVTTVSYRYDKYGRITHVYKYNGFVLNPEFKLQKMETLYDISGKVLQTHHFRKGVDSYPDQIHFFTYNSLGQLDSIYNVSATVANYSYFPSSGNVKSIILDKNGTNPVTISYKYEINGGISSIKAERKNGAQMENIFSQDLFYDVLPGNALDPSAFNRRFDGGIARTEYALAAVSPTSARSVDYQYDNMSRLLRATYHLVSGGARNKTDAFSETISYEDDGRVKSLRRGATATNSGGGEYHYLKTSNRLTWVEPGMEIGERDRSGSSESPAFHYDPAGRMTYDQSKLLNIKYDHRSLPLEFTYFDNTLESRQKVVMRYGEDGNRLAKMEFSKPGLTPLNEIMVDADPNRVRDYPGLHQAWLDMQFRIAVLTQNPGDITIHVVPESDGDVSLKGIGDIVAFGYENSGKAGFDIVGIWPSEAGYQTLADDHSGGFDFEKSTHYTSLGSEIREEWDNVTDTYSTKLLLDMPQSLGRYDADMAHRLFYVKNHLGNTVASFHESGTGYGDIFEYFPYGRQVKAYTSSNEKITQTFTGKELDEGIGLYYFGARHYDPDLGLWTSPDAARQFYSPYSFAGNDFNPVNSMDNDGNFRVKKHYAQNGEVRFTLTQVTKQDVYEMKGTGLAKKAIRWATIPIQVILSSIFEKTRGTTAYKVPVLARVGSGALSWEQKMDENLLKSGLLKEEDLSKPGNYENNISEEKLKDILLGIKVGKDPSFLKAKDYEEIKDAAPVGIDNR